MFKNTEQKYSEYGHFSRKVVCLGNSWQKSNINVIVNGIEITVAAFGKINSSYAVFKENI